MKTPDEIKKALTCVCGSPECEDCAYATKVEDKEFGEILRFHCSEIYKDAYDLIIQLESRHAKVEKELAFKRECLAWRYRDIARAEDMLDELTEKLSQAERERDAAVHDLPIGIDCNTCKYSERAYEEQPCSGCKEYRGPWYPLHWEWRGVCPENTKEDTTDEPT